MPDAALLMLINVQKVYFDTESIEKSTGVRKQKYKLAGNFFSPMGIYTFFDITSKKLSCWHKTTITVGQSHWEDKHPKHLRKPESYVDAKKVEVLTGKEIAQKMRDDNNGFAKVARLCDSKYIQLKNLSRNINTGGYMSEKKKKIVEQSLSDVFNISEVNDNILDQLGLL